MSKGPVTRWRCALGSWIWPASTTTFGPGSSAASATCSESEEDRMAASLKDACVVVIGGSSGIGLATAKMAHEAGARIVIAGRDKDRLAAAQQEIGPDTQGFAVDVADEAAVKNLFASLDKVDHVATLAGT